MKKITQLAILIGLCGTIANSLSLREIGAEKTRSLKETMDLILYNGKRIGVTEKTIELLKKNLIAEQNKLNKLENMARNEENDSSITDQEEVSKGIIQYHEQALEKEEQLLQNLKTHYEEQLGQRWDR